MQCIFVFVWLVLGPHGVFDGFCPIVLFLNRGCILIGGRCRFDERNLPSSSGSSMVEWRELAPTHGECQDKTPGTVLERGAYDSQGDDSGAECDCDPGVTLTKRRAEALFGFRGV